MSTPFSLLNIQTTLPPIIIGRQSDVVLRTRALELFAAVNPTFDVSEGSDVWALLAPFCIVLGEAYGDLVDIERRTSLAFATGTSLDLLGELYGITRGPAAYAYGEVTFSGQPNSVIAFGTVVTTQGPNARVFATTVAAQIPPGGNSVTVPVRAVATGSAGNVPAGGVVLFGLPVPAGLFAVTNAQPMTGGADLQPDGPTGQFLTGYRSDIWRLMDARGEGGAAKHLRKWARSVPGVGQVVILEATPRPGWVTISLLDIDGQPASADLVHGVEAFLVDPWYLAQEAESLALGGGASLSTQPDGTPVGADDNTVLMPAGSSVTQTQLENMLPQQGIWRLIGRFKGSGMVQVGVWNNVTSDWVTTRPNNQGDPAVQTRTVSNVGFLQPSVDDWQDFAYTGREQLEARITCTAGSVYLDQLNYWATMSRDDRDVGLTPAQMRVLVKPADAIVINVSAHLEYRLGPGQSQASVQAAARQSILDHLASIAFQPDNDVRRAAIENVLFNSSGVGDVSNVLLNGATANIMIPSDAVAVLGSLAWT